MFSEQECWCAVTKMESIAGEAIDFGRARIYVTNEQMNDKKFLKLVSG